MAELDLEIVRASWDAWIQGDMEALFEFYDPEEFVGADGGVVRVEIYRDEAEALEAVGLRE
jgi:hypothetical protein